jgi:nucleoside-diphosphate-sugar epimerase
MRIAITGGFGYIGSLLLARTAPDALGRITVIDNGSARLFRSTAASRVSVCHDDILTAPLDRLIERAQVVVHLAAMVGANAGEQDAARMTEINVAGTRRVAEACLRSGARLVFPSTTSVYGSRQAAVDEQCRPDEIRPQTAYAASKLRGERCIETLGLRGLRYTILRFGSAFGASINIGVHTAINRVCWQASAGQPLNIWRTALHQIRPYVHVDDAVGAIQFVIARQLFSNHVYNVVSANATMGDVVDAIAREVPTVDVRHVDSPLMNDLSYSVAADRLRTRGFTARGDLVHGIHDTISMFRRMQCAS